MNKGFYFIVLSVFLFCSILLCIEGRVLSSQWKKSSMDLLDEYGKLNNKYVDLSKDYVEISAKYRKCISKQYEASK